MKIDLNFDIIDLSNQAIGNAGKLVANLLVQQSEGDVMKHYEWAIKLNSGQVIDLDTSDQEYLKTFIKDHKTLFIIAKAQILEVIKKKDK